MAIHETLMERRLRLLGPAYRLFYEEPVHLVRGEGVWLHDAQGKAYLDAYNNVPVVGHCHPAVVRAMAEQAATLNTHTRYLHETVLDYAEALLSTFPAELGQVMFTCTGSESNDLALRLARNATGATGVIVSRYAYHGVTLATADLSPSLGASYRKPEHVELVDAPNPYRQGADAATLFVEEVRHAIDRLAARGIRPAALMMDTILSSDGVFSDVTDAMQQAVACVRAAGGLFIADEVQAGFGRTGGHMWGFQRHQLVPDIVTLGKPMGNGHPMAGVVARPALLDAFGRDCRYFNTFGGNPVSSAVGLAVLRVIQQEGLVQHAEEVGTALQARLRDLAERYPLIGDVRGAGLFVGVELVRHRHDQHPATKQTVFVVNRLRQKGILISGAGPMGNVLKIRPPLPFSFANVEQLINTLDETLGELT